MTSSQDFAAEVMADRARLLRWCEQNLAIVDLDILGDPEPLSGGLLNHVWKVPAFPASLVFKWSADHVASAPEIPLDPARSGFEARALRHLASNPQIRAFAATERICAPTLLGATSSPWVTVTRHVDVVGDIGAACTSAGFGEDAMLLGRWLAALHASTLEGTRTSRELSTSMNNLAVQQTRAEVQYDALATWLEAREQRVAARLLRELGERFLEPGRCLIMGDLWPPSVLVTRQDELVVIDWEFAHFGHPAQDLGHLCAHLWLGWRKTGARRYREQLEAFARGYAFSRGALSSETITLASQHCGAEILARTVGAFAMPELDAECVELLVHDAMVDIITPRSGLIYRALVKA